jgi:hypothetical protein
LILSGSQGPRLADLTRDCVGARSRSTRGAWLVANIARDLRRASRRTAGRSGHQTSAGRSSKPFRTAVSTSASTRPSATSLAASSTTARASSPWTPSSSRPATASSSSGPTPAEPRLPGRSSLPALLVSGPCKAGRSSGCSSAPIPFRSLERWPGRCRWRRKPAEPIAAPDHAREKRMRPKDSGCEPAQARRRSPRSADWGSALDSKRSRDATLARTRRSRSKRS